MKMLPITQPILAAALISLQVVMPAVSQEPVDPFAEGPKASSASNSNAATDPFGGNDQGDPFRKARRPGLGPEQTPSEQGDAGAEESQVSPQVSVLVEYIQLAHAEANRVVRENVGKRDVTALREELETMIVAGSAELLETNYSVTRSGQRAKTGSQEERIYPTEYDPPELPQTITIGTENVNTDGKVPFKTPANPTAFETRMVGTSVEYDPATAARSDAVELNIACEWVEFMGMESMVPDDLPFDEAKTIRMPIFHTLDTTSTVSMRSGETLLLGVHTPSTAKDKRILVLLRTDIVK